MNRAPLDAGRLSAAARDLAWVDRIEVRESVGSTNDELRALAAAGAADGTAVIAARQTAGRGRWGRQWYSEAGLGLYLSVLFRDPGPAETLTRWTLAAALAAAEACRRASRADVRIEWPNDLVWNRAKLGGILAEGTTVAGRAGALVVGTGINVSHSARDFPPGLGRHATSLSLAGGGRSVAREDLALDYLERLGGVARLLRRGAWEALAARWEELALDARGRTVRVHPAPPGGGPAVEGRTMGLDSSGALRVRRPDGRMVSVHLADSVSPLEG